MHCVKSARTIEDTIKKSRFIGVIVPCDSERDILEALHELQQAHPGANHIAFAFRLKTSAGIKARFYDAGEPSGTAGKPIFHHLEGKGLINVLVAVVRYFGGVKLGAGGLTRAYGNAARRVIEESEIVPYVEWREMRLTLGYERLQALEYALNKFGGRILSQDFSDRVQMRISLPEDKVESFREQFGADEAL